MRMQKSSENRVYRRNYIWNRSTCVCENDKYLGSIIHDSAVTCDEIVEPTKNTENYFGKRKPHIK